MTVTLTDRSPSMLSLPQSLHRALPGDTTLTFLRFLQAISPASHSVNTLRPPYPVVCNAPSRQIHSYLMYTQVLTNFQVVRNRCLGISGVRDPGIPTILSSIPKELFLCVYTKLKLDCILLYSFCIQTRYKKVQKDRKYELFF